MDNAPATVLNVNDTDSARYLVTRILRHAGYRVIEARTGADALHMARTQSPDLVVLDVKLPDISGLDVARILKADSETAGITILQTSATFVTSEGKARGIESGAEAYLTQPFESIELVTVVKSLLRLRHSQTEARHRADALSEADKRKDEFLAMLAHELRNPLNAVISAARLLEPRVSSDTDSSRLVAMIDRQALHLARLVDDLLDVSRITRGKIQLKKQALDLRVVIDGALASSRSAFEGERQRLSVRIGEGGLWMDGDPVRIEQVLMNLLGNAAKYTMAGGEIDLAVDRIEKDGAAWARIALRDNGVGIAKEHLSHLFDLFFQADVSLARSQGGLGIGLTMVHRLVAMHGGTITAHSEGIGTGAEFVIHLPLIADPSARAEPSAQHPDGGAPQRVLLIDDNVDSCLLYEMGLTQAGHVVAVAHDGQEGLRIALDELPDVAVVDIGLPILDGYEVARRIVAQLGERRPFLIALSGYGRVEDKERARASGFDLHLVKPLDVTDLRRVLVDVRRGGP